jgi:hypothetical protein
MDVPSWPASGSCGSAGELAGETALGPEGTSQEHHRHDQVSPGQAANRIILTSGSVPSTQSPSFPSRQPCIGAERRNNNHDSTYHSLLFLIVPRILLSPGAGIEIDECTTLLHYTTCRREMGREGNPEHTQYSLDGSRGTNDGQFARELELSR